MSASELRNDATETNTRLPGTVGVVYQRGEGEREGESRRDLLANRPSSSWLTLFYIYIYNIPLSLSFLYARAIMCVSQTNA